jgi:hypothetical protein
VVTPQLVVSDRSLALEFDCPSNYLRVRRDHGSQLTTLPPASTITQAAYEVGPGMSVSPSMFMSRTLLCWMMIAVIPASLLGADTGAAMLYGKGVVLVNGATLPNSSAIYPDDVIETKADSVANINVTGSTVMVMPESIVKFENNAIELERGSVTVSTSDGMKVHVKCVTVIPSANVLTQFDVTNTNGTVHAAARKSDVNIETAGKLKKASEPTKASQNATLREGQNTTRDENSCAAALDRGAHPTATGGLLSSPYAMYGGGAVAGGILLWVLLQGDDPPSPSGP